MGKSHGTISGIYKIQSRIKPERVYVGSTVNMSKRWSQHKRELCCNEHNNARLQNHVNKYGIEDLEFSIIVGCSKCTLVAYEQFYIDALDPWFNIRKIAGNGKGVIASEETIRRLSESHKGQVPWNKGLPSHNRGKSMSDEQKEKLRQQRMGDKNPMFGVSPSSDTLEKRREAMRIFYNSPKGIENRKKKSEAMRLDHPMRGGHHSEEALKKMRKPRSERAKQNMRKPHKPYLRPPVSEESRQKMRISALNRNTSKNGKTEILVPAL